MTNAIQSFNHQEFGAVRVVDQNGEPWFIAKDVAEILGYENPSKAVRDHCKKVNKISHPNASLGTSAPPMNMLVIPESDVYRLVMRSELPNAEKFKDWVCVEVLPTIRKTGVYNILAGIPKEDLDYIQSTRFTIHVLTALEGEKEKNLVLTHKVDDLSTKLGDNENWKRVSAIPWLKSHFDMTKAPGVYQAIGKELTRMTRLMGIEKKYAKSFHYANAIGVYHMDVINNLEEELKKDGGFMKEYRRPRLRRRKNATLRLVA